MTGRRVPIGSRPASVPAVDSWIRSGKADTGAPTKAEIYTARLTLDVTPELRARIKVIAFQRGVTVAELLRALLERQYPDEAQTR